MGVFLVASGCAAWLCGDGGALFERCVVAMVNWRAVVGARCVANTTFYKLK